MSNGLNTNDWNSIKNVYTEAKTLPEAQNKAMDKGSLSGTELNIFEKYDKNSLSDGRSTVGSSDNKLDISEISNMVKDIEVNPDAKSTEKSLVVKFLETTGIIKQSSANSDSAEVTVKAWGSGEDDCLSRIVEKHYNVDPYSEEGQKVMQKVIEANPGIYNSGRKTMHNGAIGGVKPNSPETLLYTGDKVNLPGNSTKVQEDPDVPTDNSTDGNEYGELNPAPTDPTVPTTDVPTDNSTDGNEYGELNPAPTDPTVPTTEIPTDSSTDGNEYGELNPAPTDPTVPTTEIPTDSSADVSPSGGLNPDPKDTNIDKTPNPKDTKSDEEPNRGKGFLTALQGMVTKGIGGIVDSFNFAKDPLGATINVAKTIGTIALCAFPPTAPLGFAVVAGVSVIGGTKAIGSCVQNIQEAEADYAAGDAEAYYENCEEAGGDAFNLGLSVVGTFAGIKGFKTSMARRGAQVGGAEK